MYNTAELLRRIESIIVFASISETDETARRLRVSIDDGQISGWLPWPADIGRNYIRWHPLRIGCGILLACPSGNLANAQIIGQTYSKNLPPPSSAKNIDTIVFEDGTAIEYNSESSTLSVDAVGDIAIISGTETAITAPTISITADTLNITAAVIIDGPVTQAGGDITSDGIGLQAHKHTEQGDGQQTSPSES